MITVVNVDGTTTQQHGDDVQYIHLTERSEIYFEYSSGDVATSVREGDDLVLTFNDGKVVRIDHYFDFAEDMGGVFFAEESGAVVPLASGLLAAVGAVGAATVLGGGGSADDPAAPTVDTVNGDELSGTAEPGATVTLYDANGDVAGTAIADANGDYSFAPNPLGEGEEGTVTATDAAGNESDPIAVGPVDATDPAATVDTVNGDELSGTAEPGATVTLYDANGDVAGTAIADANGDYSFAPNPLGEGEEGTVTATDAAGNESDPIAVGPVDATDPAATVDTVNGDELSGTAEPGATVTLYDANGDVAGTAIADANGDYSFAPNPLGEGEEGTVTATDAAGNESDPIAVGPVDATDPAATVDTVNGDELSGTAEPGATVTLYDANGDVAGTAIADANGDYSFAPNPLGEGEEGTVTATDAAGNESDPIAVGPVDATDPAAPTVDTVNGDELSGTAEPGATVTLYDANGDVAGTAIADANGDYSFAPNPLGEGEEGTVTATDAAGNESDPIAVGPVDATDPAATVDTVNGDELSGTAEPGATVTLYDANGDVAGTAIADANGDYSFAPNPLGEGEEGTVTATDAAGNESDPIAVGPVDATDPAATVDTVNGDELSGTAEPGATVTLYDANGDVAGTAIADANGDYSFAPNPLGEGEEGTVTATDAAGNESDPIAVGPVDATDPAATVDTVNGDELSGTAEPGATVTLYDANGDVAGTAIADANGDYSFAPNPLGEGEEGTVTATDAAGNESDPIAVGPVDATEPAVPTVDTVNGDELSGTAEPGATVTLYDANGDVAGTAIADANGDYSFAPNPLGEGEEGTVTATDAAGNESDPIAVGPVDATAPDAPVDILTSYNDDVGAVTDTNSFAASTDDTQPGINIGAGLTDTPNLYVNGELVAATYDEVTGTLTPDVALTDGTYEFTVTQTDAAGNESVPSGPLSITVDATEPAVPTVDTVNGDELSGTAEPGATVTLYDANGDVAGTAIADANGDYSFAPNPLGEGEEGTVTATDAAGNESGPIAVGPVDATAPDAPAAPANYNDDIGDVTDANSTAVSTDDTQPGINVGAGLVAPDIPNLYVDGVAVAATYDEVTGTLTPDVALTDGTHEFTLTLTDTAGNESDPSGPLSITVDTTAPDAPAAPANYNDDIGDVTDPNSTEASTDDTQPGINVGAGLVAPNIPNLYVDGVAVAATYDEVTGTLTPDVALTDGTHEFTLTLTDTAGNESDPSGPLSITVDTTAPDAPAAPASYNDDIGAETDANSTEASTDDTQPGINVGAGLVDPDIPNLYVDGVAVAATYDEVSGTLTPDVALTDGTYAFTLTLTDAAGNESDPSGALTVTIDDPTPPATIDLSGTAFGGQLINPVVIDGRTFYQLDSLSNHNELDDIFNAGVDTTDLTDTVDVMVDGETITLHLPSRGDFEDIDVTQLVPAGWANSQYWTSTLSNGGVHVSYNIGADVPQNVADTINQYVALEVV